MFVRFLLRVISNLLIIAGFSVIIFTYVPILYSEVRYFFWSGSHNEYLISSEPSESYVDSVIDLTNVVPIEPADPNFSLIISKIEVNAPVVKNVSTGTLSEYMNALKNGVAHSRGTALPGENGNMFLFAHSSINFWELGKYATVFNLLNKLESGDELVFYYEGKPYVYEVFQKKIVSGWDTKPFDDEYDVPVVTLITCYPPGATLNRLVVKAKM